MIRRLAAQYAATCALLEAQDVIGALRSIVRDVSRELGCEVGVAWLADARELTPVAFWSGPQGAAFERATRVQRFGRGVGLPGRVWASGEAAWIADLCGEPRLPRGHAAAQLGLRSAFAIPIRLPGRVVGVLEFFSVTPAEPDRMLLDTMSTVGEEIGLFMARQEAEQKLRSEQERYRLITDTSPDAILLIDENSIIRSANPAVEHIFGWRPEELVGRKATMLMPPDARARHEISLAHFLRTGERHARWTGFRLSGLRRDGSLVPLEISLGTFALDGSRLFTGILRDISERVEQQQQLARKTTELQATVKQLQRQQSEASAARADAVLAARWSRFLSEAGRALATVLDADETLHTLADLAVPAVADLCMIDVVQEDGSLRRVQISHTQDLEKARAQEYWRRFPPDPAWHVGTPQVIRTGEPKLFRTIDDETLRALTSNEDQIEFIRDWHLRSVIIVPMIARGHTLGAITLATMSSGRSYDQNDLATAEALASRTAVSLDNSVLYEQAVSANRAKSNFLAIMSHELRTPLTAIMGYTDIMQVGIAGELTERQREYMERIMVSARHLLQLIDEILTFSRLEVGRERTRYQRVPLREFTEVTADVVRPAMLEKRLDFSVELPPPDAYVETDPEKLRQILLDVLFNAVKFTPRGEVALRARVESETVVFEVEDTGIGIRREDLPRIFDPFWQAEEAMTRRKGGAGMGLSLAQRLARVLGGGIEVQSTPGRGSIFTVRIPQRVPGVASVAA